MLKMLATICASVKFTLTAGGIFFVIYGGIHKRLDGRLTAGRSASAQFSRAAHGP